MSLGATWLGRNVYLPQMGRNMRNLFEKHVDVLSKNPRLDLKKISKAKLLPEFDR